MARRTTAPPPEGPIEERIVDIDVRQEMEGAFLEYAYSVIYSRALPDARDGLKPVQRRILFGMNEMGVRPDRGHVKCSRIVGEVMGKYHPHGDGAIYDALVRLAQDFTMRVPLVDGHGNFGDLDNGPAASRYTEARMALSATLMVAGLDESTVEFVPNYDDQLMQPSVLPAAFPNLLVNGASGIAVGMATNMPPHNLVEVVTAARHLIDHPEATLEDLMRFVPGPDLPCGGRIVSLEGIREAYATGRGIFRTRATARIENVTARKKGIVITELPYLVGPEKVRDKLAALVRSRRLQGISDFKDLSDLKNGLRLVIEIKNGFNPEAVLEQLYRLTPLEDSFGINNVALVDGQPKTLGLRELLSVYVEFRTQVVRRRTEHRLSQREARLHLVEGLLVAILDIDEVISVIRSSDDAEAARTRLMTVFDLSQLQADYILELRLRRLTKFSRIELEAERDELVADIDRLRAILADRALLLGVVSGELAEVASAHGTPRRTVLLESAGSPAAATTPLEVTDDPCWVLLSSTGLLARTTDDDPLATDGPRAPHDAIVAVAPATARGEVALVTSAGRMHRVSVVELPTLPPTHAAPSLSGGAPLSAFVTLPPGEAVLTVAGLQPQFGAGLALGTETGVVKRVVAEYPSGLTEWEVIGLRNGDRVVGAVQLLTGSEDLVFVTSDAQLLHFPADAVRPQGRPAGGVSGIRLAAGARVVFFGAVDTSGASSVSGDGGAAGAAAVVTIAGSSTALPGTQAGSVKVSEFSEYPTKGRGTGGVRCHRFLRGEDVLVLGWAGAWPARAAAGNGVAVALPEPGGRRDGSGVAGNVPIAAVAGRLTCPVSPDPDVEPDRGPTDPSEAPDPGRPGELFGLMNGFSADTEDD
ncbi:MAG TPA: DNA topoisomerase IV subunit A [Dermatophilaceae bacterium]|nr:DNA topoisomerase IV subunit A [Dermatophilaceae bacterium]